MSSGCNDILQMLDYLKLPVMAESLERMMDDPASFELSVLDFLKQIVSDEYVEREICTKGVKCLYIDYVRLVDTLTMLRGEDIQKYYKKLKKYSSYQVLLIDDFLSGIPSIDNTAVFFQLLKEREKAGNPTIIGTQYDPQEWPKMLSGGNSTQGDADAIRRRLVDKAYLVVISKEE